jgi:S1-C subfamily serine protease
MSWDPTALLADLKAAVERFNQEKAARVCDEIVAGLERGEPLGTETARQVLSTLRRKAGFASMERVAEALYFTGQDDLQIRRQYAQALIDQGKVPAAVYVLESLIVQTADDPEENAEARGLLGRVYKQLYVNAVNEDREAARLFIFQRHLQRAVEAYLGVYRSDPARYLWHGINAVALAQRASRDGVPLPDVPACTLDVAALPRAVLDGLAARGPREGLPAWDLATGAEASVALGDANAALLWLAQYVQRQDVDAFELASTLRQLTEVWGLTIEALPGSLLLPLLQSQLLQRRGGSLALTAGEVSPTLQRAAEHAADDRLEKVLGREGVVTLSWYRVGLDRTRAVAKILNPLEEGFGTGFLIRGSDLAAGLGAELLLFTNAHVISNDPAVQAKHGSLDPAEAIIAFEAFEAVAQQRFRAAELLWTSPPDQLDATLLRLDPPVPATAPYPIARRLPLADGVQKVYVIGHPGGRSLSISLNDNLLLDSDERLVHYRAPTEGGSSGSPVFNQQWDLIGLHHAGGLAMPQLNGKEGTYPANEGIWIQRIIKALAEAGIGGQAAPAPRG